MKKTKDKKLIYVFTAILLFSGIGLFVYQTTANPDKQVPVKCGMENCHGMDITCGQNVPEVCTGEYLLGDKCRPFASCEVVNGKCQLIKSERFGACKSCVEKCLSDFKNDYIRAFDCGEDC